MGQLRSELLFLDRVVSELLKKNLERTTLISCYLDNYFGMRKKHSSKRKITGKELSLQDELNIKIAILVELLEAKGVLSKGEFERVTVMRLHEISKARAFEDLDEEI